MIHLCSLYKTWWIVLFSANQLCIQICETTFTGFFNIAISHKYTVHSRSFNQCFFRLCCLYSRSKSVDRKSHWQNAYEPSPKSTGQKRTAFTRSFSVTILVWYCTPQSQMYATFMANEATHSRNRWTWLNAAYHVYTIQPCKMKFWSNCFCYVHTARFLRKQTLRESTSKLFARNNTLIVWRMRFQQIAKHASNTDIFFSRFNPSTLEYMKTIYSDAAFGEP